MALRRQELWPTDGEHLGKIAIELAEAARQIRGNAAAERDETAADPLSKKGELALAEQFETAAADALHQAAAHGCDLASLRTAAALAFLQDDPIWVKLKPSSSPVGSSP